jgi:hypothetical protein
LSESTLEQKVEVWNTWMDFNHNGPQCEKCHQITYLFNIGDTEGFCVGCFNKRWPHSSSGPQSAKHTKKKKQGMLVEATQPAQSPDQKQTQGH